MNENICQSELFRIINRAIICCTNCKNMPANTEISIFRERCAYRLQQDKQQEIYKEDLFPNKELEDAVIFCNCLEAYRLATDIYAEENPEIEEWQYRYIHQGIERYREHILPENIAILNVLEHNIKQHLPEYRELMLLEEYNKDACRIYNLKLEYNRRRHKKQIAPKDYEKDALCFFKNVLHDEELKKIKGCPEKLTLYLNSLRIVDCLPADKYNRTAKFTLKRDLNYAIKITSEALSRTELNPEQTRIYAERAQKAKMEQLRYAKAIDCINLFKEGNSLTARNKKFRKKELSIDEINRRAHEEWLYK